MPVTQEQEQTQAPTRVAGDTVTTRWQAWIDRPVYARAVATVGGMQEDVDPRYSMRRFLEDALISWAESLEQAHHGGAPWPESGGMRRGGTGARSHESPDVVLLQAWIDHTVRARTIATINGMKRDVETATTLRSYAEDALTSWAESLERTHHSGQPWPENDGLRQGRRPT